MPPTQESARILVVDDEGGLRASLTAVLADRYPEYDVVSAGSAEEALELARDTTIRCLITDLKLPDVDGLELIRKIKEGSPNTALLLITAYGKEPILRRAGMMGCHAYLEKPFQVDRLLLQVDALLGKPTEIRCVLPDVCVTDILELYVGREKSSLLEIISEYETAYIAIENGILVDAQFAGKRGAEALIELLELRQGQISSHPLGGRFERTLSVGLEVFRTLLKSKSAPERLLLLQEHARPHDLPVIRHHDKHEIRLHPLPEAESVAPAISPRPQNLLATALSQPSSERTRVIDDVGKSPPFRPVTTAKKDPWAPDLLLQPEPKFAAENAPAATRREIRERKIKELVATGIAEFRAYRLDSAKRAWVSALRLDPECSAAKRNLDILDSLTKSA